MIIWPKWIFKTQSLCKDSPLLIVSGDDFIFIKDFGKNKYGKIDNLFEIGFFNKINLIICCPKSIKYENIKFKNMNIYDVFSSIKYFAKSIKSEKNINYALLDFKGIYKASIDINVIKLIEKINKLMPHTNFNFIDFFSVLSVENSVIQINFSDYVLMLCIKNGEVIDFNTTDLDGVDYQKNAYKKYIDYSDHLFDVVIDEKFIYKEIFSIISNGEDEFYPSLNIKRDIKNLKDKFNKNIIILNFSFFFINTALIYFSLNNYFDVNDKKNELDVLLIKKKSLEKKINKKNQFNLKKTKIKNSINIIKLIPKYIGKDTLLTSISFKDGFLIINTNKEVDDYKLSFINQKKIVKSIEVFDEEIKIEIN